MSVSKVVLDRQAVAKTFDFGTTSASGEGLVTIYKGTAAASTVVLDVKGSQNVGGDLNVIGNLNITGNINETSVTQLNVTDLTIKTNVGGSTPSNDTSGLKIEGTSAATVGAIFYNAASATKFSIGDGTTQSDIVDRTTAQTLTNKTLTSAVLTTPVINGISTGTGVATGATVSTLALRDTNGNLTAVSFIGGYSTTATAAGTTTLTVASNYLQVFTGVTTQIVTLPVTSTLVLGQAFEIVNNSTGLVTVNSSGGNAVLILQPNTSAIFTCILTSGTSAASWDQKTNGFNLLPVILGGTGIATATAYSVICGGTTATGPFQSLAALGASGTVLTSNGPGALPSFQTVTVAKYFRSMAITGTQDGSNKVFTLASTPDSGSEQIFINGQLLMPGSSNDYVLSAGTTITFQSGFTAPASTDTLRAYGNY